MNWSLDRAVSLAGTVRDSRGNPVPGTTLKLEIALTDYDPVTTTDGAGSFQVDEIPSHCVFRVLVDAGAEISDSRAQYTAEGEPLSGIEIVLQSAAAVSGRIVDASNLPLAGAQIALDSQARTFADESGRFSIAKLWPGEYAVSVAPADESRGRQQRVTTLNLAPGERSTDLILVYSPTNDLAVSGRVLDFDGRPVANAALNWFTLDGSFAECVTTGPDGFYGLRDLQPGDYYLASINYGDEIYGNDETIRGQRSAAAGSANVDFSVEVSPPKDTPSEFTLEVKSKSTGRPVTDLEYVFLECRGQAAEEPGIEAFRIIARSGFGQNLDSAGRIPLRVRPGASYVLAVRAIGHGLWLGFIDSTLNPRIITLEPESRVTGRVVDRAGQPIAGATLVYEELIDEIAPAPDEFGYLGSTFADGTFDVGGLPVGEIAVTFVHDGYVPTRVPLRGGTAPPVVMPRAGVIRGVVTIDGEPRPDVYVQVVEQDDLRRHGLGGVTDENGRYSVSRLRLGHSKVHVSIFGFDTTRRQTQEAEVDIGEGDVIDLDFSFSTNR